MSLVLCLFMEWGFAHWRSILFCMTTTHNAKREMEKDNQAVYLEDGSLFGYLNDGSCNTRKSERNKNRIVVLEVTIIIMT